MSEFIGRIDTVLHLVFGKPARGKRVVLVGLELARPLQDAVRRTAFASARQFLSSVPPLSPPLTVPPTFLPRSSFLAIDRSPSSSRVDC